MLCPCELLSSVAANLVRAAARILVASLILRHPSRVHLSKCLPPVCYAAPAACSGNPPATQYGTFDCGNTTDSGRNCTARCSLGATAGLDGAPTSTCLAGSWGNSTGSCLPLPPPLTTYQTVLVTFTVVIAGDCTSQMTAALVAGVIQDVAAALDAAGPGASTLLNIQPGPCSTRVRQHFTHKLHTQRHCCC